MTDASRKSLLLSLKIGLDLLPRWMKHDLWRQCEPQHTRAVERISETLVSRIENDFTLVAKPPRDTGSAAHLYVGWKPPEE